MSSITSLYPSDSKIQIDFDEPNLAAGDLVSEQLDGVEFSTSSEFGVMIFDTNNVTGEDSDLEATELGNVLIISEDGDSSDPDDNAAGGTINLDFDSLVAIDSIGLLDIDEPGSSIAFYDENSDLIETVEIDNLGDNSFQEIDFNIDRVAKVEIDLAGSGAVTGIDFTPTENDIYSNIYVFGDSLVDIGNLFNTTTFAQEPAESLGIDIPVIPPSPPYFEGRFSNGQLWIDNLAQELEIDLTPSSELSFASPDGAIYSPITLIDGNIVVSPFFNGNTVDRSVNFAYGSATTGASGTGELGELIPGVQQQVDFFITDHLQTNQTADEEALYIFWAGSNDYFVPDADPELVVSNIETEIESLYGLGAREFLVLNLPDLGAAPAANNPELAVSPEELSELSSTHNLLLESGIEELEDSLTGIDITLLEIDALFADALANPEEFGLTNVTEPFLDPITFIPTAGANPDEYLFFDNIHPTAAVHAIIGDSVLETLTAEVDA